METSNSNNADDRPDKETIKIRGKHLQPMSKEKREERLDDDEFSESNPIRRFLRDGWHNSDFKNSRTVTRSDAVRKVVYDLAWFDDYNHPKWMWKLLVNSTLFERWEGSTKELRMFINTSRSEEEGHYSVYQDEIDDDAIHVKYPEGTEEPSASDHSSSTGTTEQQLESNQTEKPTTKFDDRRKEHLNKFNNTDL